ncbi:MFS transporter [Paraburkholderia sp. ZP32-5]|uniref:MFS transporter n=1 Tax=Paraburkholderia sp. ZP32-5 TaxID=2883245 RepID=UPI001F411942|nr:MFS transporter [Paraburkholderia sp. ZP32-5]
MDHTMFGVGRASLETSLKKATRRILPLLFICYFFAYLDRVNVGFAKLQMQSELGFSDAVYGFGAGVFFIGYFLFEIPSNLILHRVGARRWIARIMITWGALSAGMIFVSGPTSFYVLRFLLGIAEAGFFPGIVLYLTYWFPSARRGRITSLFMAAIPISGLIGGPLSGWVLDAFQGMHGLAGWQWLFLIEGLPTVALGVLVLVLLTDRIADARWLDVGEKRLLENALKRDLPRHETSRLGSALKNSRVWTLSLIYFCIQMCVYAISFWLPTLIKAQGFRSNTTVGLVSAIPYLAATVTMLLFGRSADATRERRAHLIVPVMMGCIGMAGSAWFPQDSVMSLVSLTLAAMGVFTALPMFWPLPSAFLGGAAAAGGLAMINSLGNLAGFVSPYFLGWMRETMHSSSVALYVLSAIALLGAVLVLRVPAKLVNC